MTAAQQTGQRVTSSVGPLSGIRPPATADAIRLLSHARAWLAEANRAAAAAERFRLAHLAALRVAAALFAVRSRPGSAPRRLRSAWALLDSVAPELVDWSAYFASGAAARAAVEAGAVSAVSQRQADDQLRAASEFLALVEGSLGLLASPLAS
jgi:hypothetical protein